VGEVQPVHGQQPGCRELDVVPGDAGRAAQAPQEALGARGGVQRGVKQLLREQPVDLVHQGRVVGRVA
jgi:hypothetical protein